AAQRRLKRKPAHVLDPFLLIWTERAILSPHNIIGDNLVARSAAFLDNIADLLDRRPDIAAKAGLLAHLACQCVALVLAWFDAAFWQGPEAVALTDQQQFRAAHILAIHDTADSDDRWLLRKLFLFGCNE